MNGNTLKEHLLVDGKPACKQTGKIITFNHGDDVDPDLVCKRCKQTMAYRSHQWEVDNGPLRLVFSNDG